VCEKSFMKMHRKSLSLVMKLKVRWQ